MISIDALLYALLSLRRDSGPTPWELCAALLDAAGTGDVVAVTRLGSYVARSLQGRLPEHMLFHHLPAELVATIVAGTPATVGIPVVLGDKDRDRHPLHVSSWPPVAPSQRLRLRQLDTLYADSHAVKLLVLDCPSSAASVLRGATRVLARHRPQILLDMTTVPLARRTAVWEDCIKACGDDYNWYDGHRLPCATPERRVEALFACASHLACGIPAELAAIDQPPANGAATLPVESAGLARLAWAGWRDTLAADPARNAGLSVPFDANLPASNFHPAETDGSGAWWRWTGPGARSSFAMPIPASGPWNLRFAVINLGVVQQPADIRLYVMGQRLHPTLFDDHTLGFGPITFPAADPVNVTPIQIITPSPRRASDQDPRRIGISLMQCTLEPA